MLRLHKSNSPAVSNVRKNRNYPLVAHRSGVTAHIREGFDKIRFASRKLPIPSGHATMIHRHLMKMTRPQINSDVNCLHTDVSCFDTLKNLSGEKQDDYPAGDICCLT